MSADTPGTIILLNGVASSGKTIIARAIQETFDEPYLYTGIDQFWVHLFPWGSPRAHEELRWRDVPIPGTDPPRRLSSSLPSPTGCTWGSSTPRPRAQDRRACVRAPAQGLRPAHGPLRRREIWGTPCIGASRS